MFFQEIYFLLQEERHSYQMLISISLDTIVLYAVISELEIKIKYWA